jgi:hypothetical protein
VGDRSIARIINRVGLHKVGCARKRAMLPALSRLSASGTSMHAGCAGREEDDASMYGSDCDYYSDHNDDHHMVHGYDSDSADVAIYELESKQDQLKTYLDSLHTYDNTTPRPILQARRVQDVLDELVSKARQTNSDGDAALDEATLDRLALVLNDAVSGVLTVLADYRDASIALEERGDPSILATPLLCDGRGPVSRHDVADTVMAVALAVLGSMERYRAAVYV